MLHYNCYSNIILVIIPTQICCELMYFDDIDGIFIRVGSPLYVSEVSVASWEHCTSSVDDEQAGQTNTVGECCTGGGESVHARVWCLVIVGLEWSNKEGEDVFTNRYTQHTIYPPPILTLTA